MTVVYYTECKQLCQGEFEKAISSIPNWMLNKLYRFRRWQDAHAFLYGKLLLKEGMRELGYDNSLESMKETQFGKPYFNDSPFTFNVSHSEGYVVCAISSDEKNHLGIDIEKIKPISYDDFSGIFSSVELKEIDSHHKFYTYWTRKEAIVKADGRGLQIPLNTIDTTNLPVKLDDERYHLLSVEINKEYITHVASLTEIGKINTVNFNYRF